jgi:hypothetical protein
MASRLSVTTGRSELTERAARMFSFGYSNAGLNERPLISVSASVTATLHMFKEKKLGPGALR